eukprot:6548426-Pyramimonas_sp.AAC.1
MDVATDANATDLVQPPGGLQTLAANREVDATGLRDLPPEDETTVAAGVAAHAAVIYHTVVTEDVAD